MPVSNSVIRRYTPPTCTLEVLAQSSALSRWMGKSVLKQLRFELRFDDPQLPEENRVAIRGDRDQLETLCTVVTNYVQEFLQMTPENFWANFSSTQEESTPSHDSEEQEDLNNPSLQNNKVNSFSTRIPTTDIHIKPNNHLTHNLFLGSLANQASGNRIQLSLLQLFDLATALDEYSEDVMALPNLNSPSRVSTIPAWAPVAAVLVLAVGLVPITWQYANRLRQQQQTAKTSESTQENIALQDLPLTANQPTPIPTLGDSGSGTFPPLGSTLPQLPNSAASPVVPGFPSVPSAPQGSTSSTSQAPLNPNLPSTSQTSPNLGTFPTASLPSSGSTLTIPETKAPNLSSSQKNNAPLTLPQESIALSSQPNQNSTASKPTSKIPNSSETNNPLSSSLPATTTGNSPSLSTQPAPLSNLPDSGNISENPALSSSNSSSSSDTDVLIAKLRQGRQSRRTAPTEVAATSDSTRAFSTPQLSEARDFLKQRWQPPSGLKQTIEYSLLVGVDGSIERIMPLGKAARDYVDRTGMPLIGEPFVSPNRNGQSLRIRAVFSPDGKVQTFTEKD
jgi:Domain of unknown function (DUF4335)